VYLKQFLNVDPWGIYFLDIYSLDIFNINYIVYIKRVLDPVSDTYYDHYLINISIDDDNYQCYFYNDYHNIFMSPDIKAFEHVILEVGYELCTSYQDLKTLLLNTKVIPILYRHNIADMVNGKWFPFSL
jgi:hypothetical protein